MEDHAKKSFSVFEPHSYKYKVVCGTIYFVKVISNLLISLGHPNFYDSDTDILTSRFRRDVRENCECVEISTFHFHHPNPILFSVTVWLSNSQNLAGNVALPLSF